MHMSWTHTHISTPLAHQLTCQNKYKQAHMTTHNFTPPTTGGSERGFDVPASRSAPVQYLTLDASASIDPTYPSEALRHTWGCEYNPDQYAPAGFVPCEDLEASVGVASDGGAVWSGARVLLPSTAFSPSFGRYRFSVVSAGPNSKLTGESRNSTASQPFFSSNVISFRRT